MAQHGPSAEIRITKKLHVCIEIAENYISQ